MTQLTLDQRIVQFPTPNRRRSECNAPATVNMIDTAIVALEAIETPTGRVRAALDYLNAERRSLERGVPNAGR